MLIMKHSKYYRPMILFALAVCLMLSACGRRYSDATLQLFAEQNAPVDPIQVAIEEVLQESLSRDIISDLSLNILFTNENYTAVNKVSEGIDIFFHFDELFYLEEAYERYLGFEYIDNSRELILLSSMPFTEALLFSLVKANNDRYFDEVTFTNYGQLEDEYLLWACGVIADTLNRELQGQHFHETVLYDLEDVLQNLKIKEVTTPNKLGSFVFEGAFMTLNPRIMEFNTILSGSPYAEYITIAHEVQHIFQSRGNETREALDVNRMLGFNFSTHDLPVDSLFWEWFIEASAERLAADVYDAMPTVYKNMVGYLDTLSLILIANENVQVNSVPNLTRQPYMETAFELFDRQTPKQQMDFMKMMYSIEIIQLIPNDFIAMYEEKVLGRPIPDGDADIIGGDTSNLRRQLRNGALTVTSQIFYETLTGRLTRDSIPLEDIFLLIAIYETGLGLHANYDDESWYKFLPGFISNYLSLQDVFFEQIAEQTGLSLVELTVDYDTFNAALETPWNDPSALYSQDIEPKQVEFLWLRPQQNDFLSRYLYRTGENNTISIRQAAELYG